MNKNQILNEMTNTLSDYFIDCGWAFDGYTVEGTSQHLNKGVLKVRLTGGIDATLKVTLKQTKKKGTKA